MTFVGSENSRPLVSAANSRNLSWSFSALTDNPQRATYNGSQEHTPHRKRSPPLKRGLRSRAEEWFFVPTLRVQVLGSYQQPTTHNLPRFLPPAKRNWREAVVLASRSDTGEGEAFTGCFCPKLSTLYSARLLQPVI